MLAAWLSEIVAFICSVWAIWVVYEAGSATGDFSLSAVGIDAWIGGAIILGVGTLIYKLLGKH